MSKREVNIQTSEETIDNSFVSESLKEANEDKLKQIYLLEAEITDRRKREAILGTDNGWLAAKEAEIATIRNTL